MCAVLGTETELPARAASPLHLKTCYLAQAFNASEGKGMVVSTTKNMEGRGQPAERLKEEQKWHL